MMNKRKRDELDADAAAAAGAKRQRRRKRSRSEPLLNDSESTEKRTALKRLFGRLCSVELENQRELSESEDDKYADENEDPLLDSVPVDMDPEQLGFLVCAQETLRFLRGRGISPDHPMFARLRTRLLEGIGEMAMA